jgi:hypothetical protein
MSWLRSLGNGPAVDSPSNVGNAKPIPYCRKSTGTRAE